MIPPVLAAIASVSLLAAEAPVPPLQLPPPPSIPVETYASTPPGARIESTLRLSLFEPWLLGGVGALRRLGDESATGLLASARLALPVRIHGQGRTGLGVAPTASVATLGHVSDHATAGLALGMLEDRRDRKTSPSALVLVLEALFPFRHDGGASRGGQATVLFMARGPFVGLGYAFVPTDGASQHAITLTVGLDFVEAFL